jgi:hypothetical protein
VEQGKKIAPFVVHASEVAEAEGHYPAPFDAEALSFGRNLGAAAGSLNVGLWQERIPPGRRTSFTHAHSGEEEDAAYDAELRENRPARFWDFPGRRG